MDSEYNAIFSTLYKPLPNILLGPRASRVLQERFQRSSEGAIVREAIDEVENVRGYRLRPDAKYFLFVNLMQMVVIPIQVRGGLRLEDLRPALRSDVALIVDQAARQAEGREISGHVVLET